jgi:hypothetical protein
VQLAERYGGEAWAAKHGIEPVPGRKTAKR